MKSLFPLLLLTSLFVIPIAKGQNSPSRFYEVNGHVLQSRGNKPLEGVYIYAFRVFRDHQGQISSYEMAEDQAVPVTDKEGKFTLKLNGQFEYQVNCVKEGYLPNPEIFSFKPNQIANGRHISIDIPMMEFEGLLVKGTVKDRLSGKPLEGAKVELFDLETGIQRFVYTDAKGAYFFRLQSFSRYVVKAIYKKYFLASSEVFSTENVDQKTFFEDLALDKISIGYTTNIPYFFDVNSVSINDEGKNHLMDIHVLLASNPGVRFEIGVHSDSRGRDEYNKLITQMQAEAMVTHLQLMGNSLSRLKPVGYGEEQIINECKNGVLCSTEKHLENRRIVLKVIGWIEE